jgi:membrane-bound lytic murein transglycosylase D
MLKYVILAVLATIFITASDPFFGTEFISKKEVTGTLSDVDVSTNINFEKIRPFLTDYQKRIDPGFRLSPLFYPTVQFWFLMYTKYPSSHMVIHDKVNLSIIYRVLDFTHLRKAGVAREAYFGTQQKLAYQEKKVIQDLLKE